MSMFCPACGRNLEVKEIQEFPDYDLVTRYCRFDSKEWTLEYRNGAIVRITLGDEEEMTEEFGFDYTCPHCGHESYVSTVFGPAGGWNCINCGNYIPNENLRPRQHYVLPKVRLYTSSPRNVRRRQRQRASTYQRAPRVSRPIPVGAVGIKEVAERLKVEPKKLRSWLRKVGWRSGEEAGSSWMFSPEEVEEVAKNFGR